MLNSPGAQQTYNQHCARTEQCADDVYCNCNCEKCCEAECYRPFCSRERGCTKIHIGDERWFRARIRK